MLYGNNWHQGVLGIIASKILEIYYKPVIVISFLNKIGVGSARSIENIDLGKIIFMLNMKILLLMEVVILWLQGLKINFQI